MAVVAEETQRADSSQAAFAHLVEREGAWPEAGHGKESVGWFRARDRGKKDPAMLHGFILRRN